MRPKRQTDRQTERDQTPQTNRQRQTASQTDSQTDRQTDQLHMRSRPSRVAGKGLATQDYTVLYTYTDDVITPVSLLLK